MKPPVRLYASMSAVALMGAWPLHAQQADDTQEESETRIPGPIQLPSPTPSPTPAPASNSGSIVAIPPGEARVGGDAVGPGSLRDFSLGGSTPRPTPAPSPAPTRNVAVTPVAPPSSAGAPRSRTPAPAPVRTGGPDVQVTPVPAPNLPPATPTPTPAPPRDLTPPPAGLTVAETGFAAWPWLLALLAAIGGGLFLWRRRRLAAAGGVLDSPAPVPAPGPAPTPPAPEPEAPAKPSIPKGVITSERLKPDLEIDVEPVRAVFSEEGFVLDYRLSIANNGDGEARGLTIRTDYLFASETQQADMDKFIARPLSPKDHPLPSEIGPGTTLRLNAQAKLPLDKAQAVMIDGRKLLLPIIAIAVRHGGQAPAHRPAAYGSWLIGRKGGSDGRMAPIRVDQGPRIIRDVELKRQ